MTERNKAICVVTAQETPCGDIFKLIRLRFVFQTNNPKPGSHYHQEQHDEGRSSHHGPFAHNHFRQGLCGTPCIAVGFSKRSNRKTRMKLQVKQVMQERFAKKKGAMAEKSMMAEVDFASYESTCDGLLVARALRRSNKASSNIQW